MNTKPVRPEGDALLESMRSALRPFSQLASQFSEHAHDDSWQIYARSGIVVSLGDLRAAQKALHDSWPLTSDAAEGADMVALLRYLDIFLHPNPKIDLSGLVCKHGLAIEVCPARDCSNPMAYETAIRRARDYIAASAPVPLSAGATEPDAVRMALEHALTRFRCLADHFKETGDEALQVMSEVDAERTVKGLAALVRAVGVTRAAIIKECIILVNSYHTTFYAPEQEGRHPRDAAIADTKQAIIRKLEALSPAPDATDAR